MNEITRMRKDYKQMEKKKPILLSLHHHHHESNNLIESHSLLATDNYPHVGSRLTKSGAFLPEIQLHKLNDWTIRSLLT
jgi:hypothetical protein